MDDEEDAAVVELAWKAALDVNVGAPSGGEEEDDDFAKLDAALSGYAAAAQSAESEHEQVDGDEAARLEGELQGGGGAVLAASAPPATGTTRFKRKNFSKELQLRSLQRYADFARACGRLPDRSETQQLLEQSYVEFLKAGGAAEEPRLTPPEFLKLIRNRRREIQARAQPQALHKGKRRRGRPQNMTEAKRRLQQENEKIQELIEVIDRVRARAKGQDIAQQRQSPRAMFQTQHSVDSVQLESLATLGADPQDQVEAILQIQRETREVQREIAERVESIHRMLRQHDALEVEEPSSASV